MTDWKKRFLSPLVPDDARRQPAGQRGNAMIYVLIVIALFAALSYVLSRHTDSSETSVVGEQTINVNASQLIQVSNQVKQGVDQLIYAGTAIDDLSFCLPADACFGSDNFNEIFHPEGGGLVMPAFPAGTADSSADTTPASGWYMGRFNNVEWTETTADDVIFVAHQIREDICRRINEILTGDPTPRPLVGSDINRVLIPATDADGGAQHGGGTADLDKVVCPTCDGLASICVVNDAGNSWSFYNVIEQQ